MGRPKGARDKKPRIRKPTSSCERQAPTEAARTAAAESFLESSSSSACTSPDKVRTASSSPNADAAPGPADHAKALDPHYDPGCDTLPESPDAKTPAHALGASHERPFEPVPFGIEVPGPPFADPFDRPSPAAPLGLPDPFHFDWPYW